MSDIVTVLDGRSMMNKDQVHDYLVERFNFPSYYGRNLDALYDLMSTYDQEDKLIILLIFPEMGIEQMGEYGLKLIETLDLASHHNPHIDFRVKNHILFNESEVFMTD